MAKNSILLYSSELNPFTDMQKVDGIQKKRSSGSPERPLSARSALPSDTGRGRHGQEANEGRTETGAKTDRQEGHTGGNDKTEGGGN